MLGRIILGALYGFIATLVWDLGLGLPILSGWLYGVTIGAILSLAIYLFFMASTSRGNVTKGEAYFVANSQSFMILVVAIILALITWLIRVIFF